MRVTGPEGNLLQAIESSVVRQRQCSFLEGSRFDCSEAAGGIRPLWVNRIAALVWRGWLVRDDPNGSNKAMTMRYRAILTDKLWRWMYGETEKKGGRRCIGRRSYGCCWSVKLRLRTRHRTSIYLAPLCAVSLGSKIATAEPTSAMLSLTHIWRIRRPAQRSLSSPEISRSYDERE